MDQDLQASLGSFLISIRPDLDMANKEQEPAHGERLHKLLLKKLHLHDLLQAPGRESHASRQQRQMVCNYLMALGLPESLRIFSK